MQTRKYKMLRLYKIVINSCRVLSHGRSSILTLQNSINLRFPKKVKFNLESAHHRFSTLKHLVKPYYLSQVHLSPHGTLRVHFKDGLTAHFPYIWLRDNCSCEICVHPKTKQKLLDLASLNLELSPQLCRISDDGRLRIRWPDYHGEHSSSYCPKWLHRYGQEFDSGLPQRDLPVAVNWNGGYLQDNLPTFEYDPFMEHSRCVHHCLEEFLKIGIVVLKNVPSEEGEVAKVINRIVYVPYKRWTPSFHIYSDSLCDESSRFTLPSGGCNLHTDMNYLQSSPGVHAIQCLDASFKKGARRDSLNNSGRHVLVDGFLVAQRLRETFPMHFRTLSSIPVKFVFSSYNMVYESCHPILKADSVGGVSEVYFNNKMMAPVEGLPSVVRDFYAAYKCFDRLMKQPQMQFRIRLECGNVVIFNNRRILHGWDSFDPNIVDMHVEGCHAGLDELTARYRYFMKKAFNKS